MSITVLILEGNLLELQLWKCFVIFSLLSVYILRIKNFLTVTVTQLLKSVFITKVIATLAILQILTQLQLFVENFN